MYAKKVSKNILSDLCKKYQFLFFKMIFLKTSFYLFIQATKMSFFAKLYV